MVKVAYQSVILWILALPTAALLGQLSPSGSIHITVTDSSTRESIPDVQVTVILQRTRPPNTVMNNATDADGRVIFQGLAPGAYSVRIQKDGYLVPPVSQPLVLTSASPTHNVHLTLTRGSVLVGHVRDASGTPVAQIAVSLMQSKFHDGKRVLSVLSGSQATDDRGEFRLVGIPPGNYLIRTETKSFEVNGQTVPPIVYYPGVLGAQSAVPLPIEDSRIMSGIDITLPSVNLYKISGTLLNAVAGRTVTYYLENTASGGLEDPVRVTPRLTTMTGSTEPLFEIEGVPSGTYNLYAFMAEVPGAGQAMTRVPLSIDDHDVTGLQLALARARDVSGIVVTDANLGAVSLQNVAIALQRKQWLPTLSPGITELRISAEGAITSSNTTRISDLTTGEFTLRNVPRSLFAVTVNGLPQDVYVRDLLHDGTSVFADGLLRADSNGPLRIILAAPGGTIRGRVRTTAGELLVSGGVTLVPQGTLQENPQLYRRASIDSTGSFVVRGIAPGQYKLFAWSSLPEGRAEENRDFIRAYDTQGRSVAVSAGSTVTFDLTAIPNQ